MQEMLSGTTKTEPKFVSPYVLSGVCDVINGYPFRAKLPESPHGDLAVFRVGDVTSRGLDEKNAARIERHRNFERHLLVRGDLLLKCKGGTYEAAVFDSNIEAIAALGLFILRPKKDIVSTGYLEWFLNHRQTQDQLMRMARDGKIGFLAKEDLVNLPVRVPCLALQEKVVNLHTARRLARIEEEKRIEMADLTVAQETWAAVKAAVGDTPE